MNSRTPIYAALILVLAAGCSGIPMTQGGGDLARKVDYLRQDVENLTKQQQELIKELKELRQQQATPAIAEHKKTAPVKQKASEPDSNPNLEISNLSSDPAAIYKAAFSLMKEKRYSEAEAAYGDFINRFPRSDLADNAQYWIGECFYAEGDLEGAAEAFKGVSEHFPFGNKVSDALYKLSVCQQKLGKAKEAEKTLQRLQKFYPDSAAAAKARSDETAP